MFLELAVLATKGVFDIFECFALLLVLALPELLLARDTLDLRLSFIKDLLPASLKLIIEVAGSLVARPL